MATYSFKIAPLHGPTWFMMNNFLLSHPGNHVASQQEVPTIEGHLHWAEGALEVHGTELQKMQVVLEKQQVQRNAMLRATNRLRAMIEPSIRKLPVEVLSPIFAFYLEDSLSSPSESGLHPLVLLGQVCAKWRAAVYSNPIFWSMIHSALLSPTRGDYRNSEVARRFTRFYLGASHGCPLQISFERRLCDGAFHELKQHSDRWRDVSIEYLPGRGREFPDNLPLLEVLAFAVKTASPEWWTAFPLRLETPRLRELVLSGGNLALAPRFVTKCLTRLVIKDKDVDFVELLKFLKERPRLSTLELVNASGSFDEAMRPRTPITLRLSSLVVLGPPDANPGFRRFFNSIAAPCLTNLKLIGESGSKSGRANRDYLSHTLPIFRDLFLSPSPGPVLTTLTLSRIKFGRLPSVFCLLERLSSTLTHLTIPWCNEADSDWKLFVQAMRYPQRNVGFLGNLKKLEVDGSLYLGTPFFEMVKSRQQFGDNTVNRKRLLRLCVECVELGHLLEVGQSLRSLSGWGGLQVNVREVTLR
ncbi:hypothetical protein L218DRAFT_960251 [Marasmius fiardii PR-910]|nr:hypothetical protein L218DRAFT_960251 [Marasmius fiardii PR-910]